MITAIFTSDRVRSWGGEAAPEQHRPRGAKLGGKINILNVQI